MLIHNLFEHYRKRGLEGMLAISVTAGQPSDNRTVVVMDHNEKGQTLAVAAKYVNGTWYGVCTGDVLHNEMFQAFTPAAIWTECLLGDKAMRGEWIHNER
jgi:hypothetical protein